MSDGLPILTSGKPLPEPLRADFVSRGRRLTFATLGYNAIEAAVSIVAGISAGSVALIGFGADSVIEMTAGAASLWRLGRDAEPGRREHAERVSRRIIGVCFLLLAAYVLWESAAALVARERPEASLVGIALAAVSLLVMPLLASAKRTVGRALGSRAVTSEAKQTNVCAWLSAVLLLGLAANALAGWWWADPVAALAMVPLIAWEGVEGLRGRDACGDGCGCS
jgi:divalent metal cation (Fe/Co/Zn/Cd) transporter